MTEQQPPYKARQAGAGRKPKIKFKLYHKLDVIFSPADYEKILRYKAQTGRTLRDIGNSAVMEYISSNGMGDK